MQPKKNLDERRVEAAKLDVGVDELSRRVASNSVLSQDAAKSLISNWQNILFAFLAVMFGYLMFERYQSTVRDRAAEGSQKLENISNQFADYMKIVDAGEGKEVPAQLRDNTEVVISTQGETFTGRSAMLYRAVAELESGHPEKAEEFIKKGNFKLVKGVAAPHEKAEVETRDLLDELATLIEARRLKAVDPSGKQSMELLTSLAYGAKFTGAEAIMTMLRMSTPAEQPAIKEVIKKYLEARPEARDGLLTALRQENVDVSDLTKSE